jgi:hypothetical protein
MVSAKAIREVAKELCMSLVGVSTRIVVEESVTKYILLVRVN